MSQEELDILRYNSKIRQQIMDIELELMRPIRELLLEDLNDDEKQIAKNKILDSHKKIEGLRKTLKQEM